MMRGMQMLLMVLLMLPLQGLRAQGTILRGEIEAKAYDFMYFVPAGRGGLLTFEHEKHFSGSKAFWELRHYSTDMQLLHKEEFKTSQAYKLVDYKLVGDSVVYAFFAAEEGGAGFELLEYQLGQQVLKSHKVQSRGGTSWQYYDVLGTTCFAAGVKMPNAGAYMLQALYSLTLYPLFSGSKVYKISPRLLWSDPEKGSQGIVEVMRKGSSSLLAARVDAASGYFSMVIKHWHKRHYSLYHVAYDLEGREVVRTELKGLNRKNILSGQLLTSPRGGQLFIGTYNEDLRKANRRSSEASGMFVSSLKDGREQMVKFHPFSSFYNAKKTLDFRDLRRFEESKRRGQKTDLLFRLLMHDKVTQMDSAYVIIGERFYPEYHYETNFGFYGNTTSDQVFDGYRFTHAIAAAFNSRGDLLWDNIFAIDNVISYDLDENVIVYWDGDSEVMLYYSDGAIYSKIISGNEILYRKEKNEVPTVPDTEQVLYESHGKMYYWYEHYFLLTGYQVVMEHSGKKRKVFFFVKLAYN